METHYVVNEQYDIRDNNMLTVYVELKNKDENQLLQTKSEPEEIPYVDPPPSYLFSNLCCRSDPKQSTQSWWTLEKH
jgi:hypothetical protein